MGSGRGLAGDAGPYGGIHRPGVDRLDDGARLSGQDFFDSKVVPGSVHTGNQR